MSPEAQRVLHALEDLCRGAHVAPTDPTDEAGRAVRLAVLAHPRLPPAHDTVLCPLSELLRRLSRVQYLVVTTERVLLTRLGEPTRARGGEARHERESVTLPPAVRAAVKLLDAPGGASRRAA